MPSVLPLRRSLACAPLAGALALSLASCAGAATPGTAATGASTVANSGKMLAGGGKPRRTEFSALSLGPGRAAYLRFRVDSSWSGSNILLSLEPSAASAGIYVKKVRARWGSDGRAHRISSYRSAGPLAGPGLLTSVDSVVDMSSQLSPGRTYTLKVWAREGTVRASLPVLRRVAPTPVAAVGDIACPTSSSQWNGGPGTPTACGQASVAALVRSSDQKVLLLGDNQYSDGTLADYRSAFGPSWGPLARRLRPVPGNHEYHTPGAAGYFDYFASVGAPTGSRGSGWYAYDSGNWRILALNSNDACTVVACNAGSAQERWLRRELRQARAAGKCTAAYWHHPRASGGSHGDQPSVSALWRAMYELGGDVVLSGHDHLYQRFRPLNGAAQPAADGPREWVVGTGGYSFYPVSARAGSAKAITDTFGLLRLNLRASGYRWEWVGVGGAGSDSGTAACRA